MPSISVRSGVMTFEQNRAESAGSAPALRVLVLGNFSGAGGAALPLSRRKHLRVDGDTFEEVFERLGVSLTLPLGDQPIRFNSLDDLHPDHLYDKVALFRRYQQLKQQLRSPAQFAQAVAALQQDGLIAAPTADPAADPVARPAAVQNDQLLESLLRGASVSENTIEQLIRQTLAPYLQPGDHPKTEEYLGAVDQAVNQVMRQIMHATSFQKLEASWRSLDLLRRRLDLDRACQLFLLDVSEAEILTDAERAGGDLTQSALLQNLQANQEKGYDLLLSDPLLAGTEDDVRLLARLVDLAEQVGALLLAGALAEPGGHMDAWMDVPQPLTAAAEEAWEQLRGHNHSARVFVAAPRYLVRLPYGGKTAVIDSFAYEELPAPGAHAFYLWGNSAYLLLLALVEGFARGGRSAEPGPCILADMPLHVYTDADGDDALKPCAEVYLAEKALRALEERGFTAMQSMRNTNSIRLGRWNSLALVS